MAWGLWNKIKKGMQKVKNKVLPAIQKGAKFISNNKDLINSGIDLLAPKIGMNRDVAHGIVNTIGSFTPDSINYLETNYGEPPDDTHYLETGGMIKPIYK